MIAGWFDGARRGFHSPVISRFVITGLGRLGSRRRLLLSRTESLFTKKSIPLIRSTHLWFTPICIYPKHRIKSMKLITRSCCLCADTHTRTHSFPLQTIIMNSTKCLQPSVLPPSHQAGQLCTLYIQYSCHVWGWGFTVWSSEQTLAITDCLLSLWKGIIL